VYPYIWWIAIYQKIRNTLPGMYRYGSCLKFKIRDLIPVTIANCQ